jgi:hypothetical protein
MFPYCSRVGHLTRGSGLGAVWAISDCRVYSSTARLVNFRVAENNRPIVKTEFGSEAFERLFFFDRTDLPGG